MNRKQRRAAEIHKSLKPYPIFYKYSKEYAMQMKSIFRFNIGQKILDKSIIGRYIAVDKNTSEKKVSYVFLSENDEERNSPYSFQISLEEIQNMGINISYLGQRGFNIYQDLLIEKGLIPDEELS